MKWVSDSEVLEGEIMEDGETCLFCQKDFETHHQFTAHLRGHSDDLNNHILNIVASAKKPMTVGDVQNLSGLTINVSNALSRLVEQNKIRRVKRGKYAANKGIAATKEPATKKQVADVANSITNSDWDALIIAQLKKHPDLYQRISNEVVAGIKKFMAFSSEV